MDNLQLAQNKKRFDQQPTTFTELKPHTYMYETYAQDALHSG